MRRQGAPRQDKKWKGKMKMHVTGRVCKRMALVATLFISFRILSISVQSSFDFHHLHPFIHSSPSRYHHH